MGIQACIFDLDGVITDTAHYHFLSWQKVAAEFDFTLTAAQNELLKGVSRSESLGIILDWAGVEIGEDLQSMWLEVKNAQYLQFISKLGTEDILPGVLKFLDEMDQNQISMAIGSSSKNARFILKKLGLYDRFIAISDGNSVTRTKPFPDVFLHAAKQMKIEPNACVVIEDAPSGVEAAIAAGMKVIGIGRPKILSKAHICLDSLEGLSYNQMKESLT